MNQDKQIMGFVAIALAAVFTIYLTSMPPKTAEQSFQQSSMPSADEMAALAPAAGEAVAETVPGSVGTVNETSKIAEDQSLNKGEAYSVVRIYSTEEECKEATNTACHFVKCEDAPAMGVETEEQEKAIENACEATEKTGWRAVVPKPDNTAVPEEIGEPIEINSEAPAP
jgi:hypothetical protein